MENIEHFGKGCLQTPPELASTRYRLAAMPVAPIDWSTPFDVEQGFTLAQRNQDGSSSCTAQATAYYCEVLNHLDNNVVENYSARFNYSQTYAPGGGAYIWKAMSIPIKIGLAGADSVPDGNSTEAEMIDQSLNGTARIEAKALLYAQLTNNKNIDELANIVKDYHGFVTGFNGSNDMFDSKGVASIPTNPTWGHAVYICGYVTLPDGRKALKFKNSWGGTWGDAGYGYFPEEFIASGHFYDAYVYATVQDIDPLSMSLPLARDPKDPIQGRVYALLETKKVKCWIPNPATLNSGNGDLWGGWDKIIEKDLSGYKDGVIQISTSE